MLRAALTAFGRGRKVPRVGYTQLTSKLGPKDYYKGKGAQPTGVHTRKGGFRVQPEKAPDFVVPDLTGFKLKPYVAYEVPLKK